MIAWNWWKLHTSEYLLQPSEGFGEFDFDIEYWWDCIESIEDSVDFSASAEDQVAFLLLAIDGGICGEFGEEFPQRVIPL